MERYDYWEESDTAGNVSAEIDGLSIKQLVLVHKAIESIKAETEAKKSAQSEEWFNTSILPTLKGYAQIIGAVLEIEKMDSNVITATLRCRSGFDISEQYRPLYAALMATVHISIEKAGDEVLLVLAYDFRNFMN